MFRIAIIGASSLSIGKKVIDEILQEFTETDLELRLMSLHIDHTRIVADYARRTYPCRSNSLTVLVTRNSREAVEGCQVVITMFDIGGFRASALDHKIPLHFGVGQCIGDTLGPGAVMRAQRVIPVLDGLRRDLEELAPNSLIINYVNPLGPAGMVFERKNWHRHIGLCDGPAAMLDSIKSLLNVDILRFKLAGTNHMSWLVSLEDKHGENLYEELRRAILNPNIAGKERVRAEILQTFGYFCSESSGQLSDMLPWFRNSETSRKSYLASGYAGRTGIYPRVNSLLHKQLGQMNFLKTAKPERFPVSRHSLVRILRNEAVNKDQNKSSNPIFGNVTNKEGRISNMPRSAIVETEISQSSGCWIPAATTQIPREVLSMSLTHTVSNELMTDAALSGNPEDLVRAMCHDPITASSMSINSIRDMTFKFIEKQSEWLPQYGDAHSFSGIDIPNLPRVEKTVFDGESFVDQVIRQKFQ
ncbi:hypothetical protein [Oceanispirochaeta sp.]|jgi:alpha-galactosidase|uniref:family 4 glycosyl hydrolase n=1 Tax=Oceanispirochaeta sp. TaxID=2035350 RepID=UPI00261B62D0|nr:hypothetical protein [Oceanispirochaeta sp.]MDA3955755.1 hypothetical protein [Oceanispirochaeta sp.]